ncbi:putative lipid II flippase FtsW [Zavarzinia sp. CC-PAN008]|uniref:putative lipid II flippase FtsW n=1 Tax=Zavarzinia sp. CC-PAN008 TaxID=3243332 RepID=UPI003F749B9D
MSTFARTDNSMVARWWWTVDRWTLGAVAGLCAIGLVLTMAASPGVAARLDLDSFHFVKRQIGFMLPAIAIIFAVSLCSPLQVRRLACIALLGSYAAVWLTLVAGPEIKGAHRWIQLGPVSIQPSEFLKPSLAVVCAWMFAEHHRDERFPGRLIATALYLMAVAALILQPDFGQTVLVTAVFIIQLFLAGLPMIVALVLVGMAVAGGIGAYVTLPHVQSRIDRFLNPESGDTYQIDTATDAFVTGGFWGRGPGEGVVKRVLPDAHTDFIMAVAAEEFGTILCLVLVALFCFVVLRGFARLLQEDDSFVTLAGAGLLAQFGLQAIINVGVNVHLLPSKGMTLPFISYGGSSLLALALGMGMVLALTRLRPGLKPVALGLQR